jgi:RNA polymerase sigma-70 factor (ECF subfamily)
MTVTNDVQGIGAGDGERQLVEAARGGDHRAFEALVLKYQDRIYRLIQRLVSGSDVVDDLAQEVFIRAYRSLGDFKGESSLYTWLYKIALNLCRNHYRTRGRRPAHEELDETDGATGLEAAGGTPEDEVFRREFWDRLQQGLDELPAEQREAVVFCDLEGMSYEEMASVIGVPIGTVRSRIFRGRRALQGWLAPFHAAGPAAPGRLP